MIEIVLPLPPTGNKLWAPVRTRAGAKMVKRAASSDWAAEAKRLVRNAAPAPLPDYFHALIVLPETRADIDGRIKPILDACQAGGAIVNDRFCRSLHVEIDESREHTALIVLTPIPPPQRQPARTKGIAGKGA
jgi:Holliday junction resolvase RusA-like endonuclease